MAPRLLVDVEDHALELDARVNERRFARDAGRQVRTQERSRIADFLDRHRAAQRRCLDRVVLHFAKTADASGRKCLYSARGDRVDTDAFRAEIGRQEAHTGLEAGFGEACFLFLAADLGPEGIRVNAISAGAVKTLAAAGIGGFRKMQSYAVKAAPLRRTVTIEEIGNTAAFLCSDLASGITGETTFVDAGVNIMGMVFDDDE